MGVLGGRALLTRRYRAAKTAAHLLALAAMRSGRHAPFPRDCALVLVVTLHAPDRRRRDVANHLKLCCDALAGAVYADDVQLADVRVVRGAVDPVQPRAELTITPLA